MNGMIGTPINISPLTVVKATVAITSPMFKAVTAAGALPTAGANVLGICINDEDAAIGDDLNVQIKDCGKWTAGTAIAVGDELTTDATGCCTKAATGNFITAIALEAATAKGKAINVQVCKAGYKA